MGLLNRWNGGSITEDNGLIENEDRGLFVWIKLGV